jgi:acetate kinase
MQPERRSDGHVILRLNSDSSSLKFAFYRLSGPEETQLARGEMERIGLSDGHLWLQGANDRELVRERRDSPDHAVAVEAMFAAAQQVGFPSPVAVGHRVVHGGPDHTTPERVEESLLADLRRLVAFAPLHLPSAIQGIEAVAARFPGLPQVACCDTAFHRRMPELAQRLPLLRSPWDEGIRRYGFHGLSYEYIVAALGTAAQGRLIIAHLGNGASLAAVYNGQPLDTSMGFTPTGGIMMGTRSGDLDPGVLLHFVHDKGYDASQLDTLVNHQAGLLGVSGLSPDMKTLLEQRRHEPHAAQAVELFCYQLRKYIGALTAVLGGLDTLVSTGGIGERAAPVRWETWQPLAYLGIALDPQQNAAHAEVISTPQSACTVRVIPTNEDLLIARHTRTLLFPSAASGRR